MRFVFSNIAYLILTLALAACGAAPSEQSSQTADDLLKVLKGPTITGVDDTMIAAAREAEAAGNYKRSASTYQQLLDKKPEDMVIKLALANALRRNGQCNDALPHFDGVLAKQPDNADALEGKGLCQMNLGDSKQAADTFTLALAADPNRWRSLNAVGILFASKGKTNEAIAYFERAQQTDSSQVAVLNNLALAYLLDKRYAQAIETFTRAQAHLPSKSTERARIDLNLALAYALSGDMDTAQRISAPHLTEAGLYNNMGFFASLAKDESLARDYLNMSLSKSPTYYKRAQTNLETVPKGAKGDASSNQNGVTVKRLHIQGKPYQSPTAARSAPEPAPVPKGFVPGEQGAPDVMPEVKPRLVKGLSEPDPTEDGTLAR